MRAQTGAKAIVLTLALVGCGPTTAPSPTEKAIVAVTERQLSTDEIKQYIAGGTQTIEPTPDRRISGDLRPLWIVAGRFTNNYDHDVKAMTVRITAFDNQTHEVLDTADITLTDIPAHTTRAFRREISLMVTWNKFYFYDSIADVTVKTS